MDQVKSQFDQNHALLRNNLIKANTFSDVIVILRNEMRRLHNNVLAEESHLEQIQIGAAFFSIFEQSISMWGSVYPAQMRVQMISDLAKVPSWKDKIISHLEILPAVAVGVGMSGWLGGPIGFGVGLLSGAVIGFIPVMIPRFKAAGMASSTQEELVEVMLKLDVDSLLDGFGQVCIEIDHAVGAFEEVPKPPVTKIENFSLSENYDLLAFFQSLFAVEMEGDKKGRSDIEKLALYAENVLNQYGIKKVIFHPEADEIDDEKSRKLFDLEQSRNPKRKESVNILPALTRGDQVVLRGRVIIPQQVAATTKP